MRTLNFRVVFTQKTFNEKRPANTDIFKHLIKKPAVHFLLVHKAGELHDSALEIDNQGHTKTTNKAEERKHFDKNCRKVIGN